MAWGAAAAAGISALMSLYQQSQNNQFAQASSDEAWIRQNALLKEQQNFYERMSNSAHQREVADLKKAGLNPILSASGGGASSTSITAPEVNMTSAKQSNIAEALSTGMQAMATHNQTKKTNSDIKLQEQQGQTLRAQQDEYATKAEMNTAERMLISAKEKYQKIQNEWLPKHEKQQLANEAKMEQKIGSDIRANNAVSARDMSIVRLNQAEHELKQIEKKQEKAKLTEIKAKERWVKENPGQTQWTEGIGRWTGAFGKILGGSAGVNTTTTRMK